MGNIPSGWAAPPYYKTIGTLGTGSTPAGTLLAAAGVNSLPAALSKAVYQFAAGASLATILGMSWGPCSFLVIGGGFCNTIFQIEVIRAPFNIADGQPVPLSTIVDATTLLSMAASPVPQTFSPCSVGSGILVGPFYGVIVTAVDPGATFMVAPGPPGPAPAPFLRWPLTVWGT
jgi:hypothetical protein